MRLLSLASLGVQHKTLTYADIAKTLSISEDEACRFLLRCPTPQPADWLRAG
jgi:hypothetical protein